MRSGFIIVTFTILVLACLAQKNRKKIKISSGSGPVCPSTCALRRRIGKTEVRLRRDIAETTAVCKKGIDTLRLELKNESKPRISEWDTDRQCRAFQESILEEVDERLTASDRRIGDHIANYQDAVNASLLKVSQGTADGSQTVEESERIENFRRVISAMNQTIRSLTHQNGILKQLSQEMRAQTAVLRARSEIANDDITRLLKLEQKQQFTAADQDRIIDLEELVSDHTTKMSSLQSKLEWISSRVEQLSDTADEARAEASSATDKATRAADVARTAIAIAKRRTPSTQDSDTHSDNDGPRQPRIPPNDCWELYQMGYNVSGVYRIRPRTSPKSFNVYCEQSYEGGGWTMIQRRRDGSVDFDREWNAYADGFGNPEGEMWLGNENMYHLTNQDDYALQVLLLDWEGNRAFAEYDLFRVQGNPDNYALEFGTFTRGNAGDGLRGTSPRDGSRNAYLGQFTTTNMDNDHCQPCIADSEGTSFYNCAELQGGGWWFRACSDSNLNGRYILPQNFSSCGEICYGMQWRTWRPEPAYSLRASIMLLRRNDRSRN